MQVPAQDLATLSTVERFAVRFACAVNRSARVQRVRHWINTHLHRHWVSLLSRRRVHLVGIDGIVSLHPARGLLLASNHRSFLDHFVIAACIYQRVETWTRFYFPVRSGFFYDNPAGILLNLCATSCTMFPPVFRPLSKRGVTRAGLDFLSQELQSPEVLVGIHPEGTRGKGPDPYALLPAEPGFGRVVLQARPVVVPVFVNGLGNNPLREVAREHRRGSAPIIIVYGEPVDLSAFADADPHLLRHQVHVGRRVLADIARLGQVERELRQRLTACTGAGPGQLAAGPA